jgi:hypothetical protein
MPVLYYPSRLGSRGLAQYVEADNAVYTIGHAGGNFLEFIVNRAVHPRGTRSIPHRAGSFLVIAAGRDRLYFTGDDIANFEEGGSLLPDGPTVRTVYRENIPMWGFWTLAALVLVAYLFIRAKCRVREET